MSERRRWVGLGVLLLLAQALFGPQWSAYVRWGILPLARVQGRPALEGMAKITGLDASAQPQLYIEAHTLFQTKHAPLWLMEGLHPQVWATPLRRASATVELLAAGESYAVPCQLRQERSGLFQCALDVPADLPSGDHQLLVTLVSAVQDLSFTLEVPHYGPAWVHVLADKPLARPGDTLRARALNLNPSTGAPLANRPGVWTVRDHTSVLLEEPGISDETGIVILSFPLSERAAEGLWTLEWTSGRAKAQAVVRVGRQALAPVQISLQVPPWVEPGEPVTVSGRARASTGAPLANRQIVLASSGSPWAPPASWSQTVQTDAQGQFQAQLGVLPSAWQGQEQLGLQAHLAELPQWPSGARITLTDTAVAVHSTSELGGGLVAGVPRLAWVRVTRPDGSPWADTQITLQNLWDPGEAAVVAQTDSEGVAQVRLAPKRAHRLLPPPQSRRAAPQGPAYRLGQVLDLRTAEPAQAQDVSALEGIAPMLSRRCSGVAEQLSLSVELLLVRGNLKGLHVEDSARGDCVRHALQDLKGRDVFPARAAGAYALTLHTQEPSHPSLSVTATGLPKDSPELIRAVRWAETCMEQAPLQPLHLVFTLEQGQLSVLELEGPGWPACVQTVLTSSPWPESGWGTLTLTATAPPQPSPSQEHTTQGFEYALQIAAQTPARVRFAVAERSMVLRPSAVILQPGQPFTLQLLRGPNDTLPEHGELDGRFEIDGPQVELLAPMRPGFHSIQAGSGYTWILVRSPQATLSLSAPQTLAPGQPYVLTVQASEPGVVSIVGLDARLDAPDPWALAQRQLSARSAGPWSAADLLLGRVGGEGAAHFILSELVSQLPSGHAGIQSPETTELVIIERDKGQAALRTALELAVLEWDAQAPPHERLTNERFFALWQQTLENARAAGAPILSWSQEPMAPAHWLTPNTLAPRADRMPDDQVPWGPWLESR